MTYTPSYLEDRISQIPAVRLLMTMGWQCPALDASEALHQHRAIRAQGLR